MYIPIFIVYLLINPLFTFVPILYNQWKLRINAEKCSVVHFRKKCVRRSSVEFRIGEEILSMLSEYKYLGIVLNEFLNGEKMREALMDNGRKALYGFTRLVRSLGNVGWATFSKLYVSMVRSTLLYGCEIWGVLSGKMQNWRECRGLQ